MNKGRGRSKSKRRSQGKRQTKIERGDKRERRAKESEGEEKQEGDRLGQKETGRAVMRWFVPFHFLPLIFKHFPRELRVS